MKCSYISNRNFKLPKELIYSQEINKDFKIVRYQMISTKTGKIVGEMDAHPIISYDFGKKSSVPCLNIDYLQVFQRNKGYGTKFLDFARCLSKKIGCEGNLNLVSSNCYDAISPPHVFYRKYGFDSNDTEKLCQIDRRILKKKHSPFTFECVRMFYPGQSKIGEYLPKTLLQRIKAFFKK